MSRATLNDALHFVRAHSSTARELGYVLAPFGSTVLDGGGRDVDVLAVPWREPNDFLRLLAALRDRGFSEVTPRHFGVMGTCAVLLRPHNGGPDIDLQIREVARTEVTLRQVRAVLDGDIGGTTVLRV